MPARPSPSLARLGRASRSVSLAAASLVFTAACEPGPPPASGAGSATSVPAAASASAGVTAGPAASSTAVPEGYRPYADMAHSLGTVTLVPIRGRVILEKGQPDLRAGTPIREISQAEVPDAEIEAVLVDARGTEIARLGKVTSDKEGYVDAAFPLKEGAVAPGRHLVDIRVNGAPAGRTVVKLLANDDERPVVRSDIDLTYLDTHFLQKSDMVALLAQSAAERKTLPAMEKVYGALRAGASGKEDRPLVFISGSPRFFKRVLEARMSMDGVEQEGVFLKPFDDIAEDKISLLQMDRVVPALKEQVGYKLGHLLRGRLELPRKAGEILMGDDSEADFVVYSIYHRLMAGELDGEAAGKELARGGVEPGQAGELVTLAAKVRAALGGFRPVKAIYIHLTGKPNATLAVSDWPVPGLLRAHRGAWPLILDLHEEGLVSKDAVAAVKARLLALGQTAKELDDAAKAGVASGFLQPESLSLP